MRIRFLILLQKQCFGIQKVYSLDLLSLFPFNHCPNDFIDWPSLWQTLQWSSMGREPSFRRSSRTAEVLSKISVSCFKTWLKRGHEIFFSSKNLFTLLSSFAYISDLIFMHNDFARLEAVFSLLESFTQTILKRMSPTLSLLSILVKGYSQVLITSRASALNSASADR